MYNCIKPAVYPASLPICIDYCTQLIVRGWAPTPVQLTACNNHIYKRGRPGSEAMHDFGVKLMCVGCDVVTSIYAWRQACVAFIPHRYVPPIPNVIYIVCSMYVCMYVCMYGINEKEMQQLSIPLFSISSPLLLYNRICICVFHSTLHSVPALRFRSWNTYVHTYYNSRCVEWKTAFPLHT